MEILCFFRTVSIPSYFVSVWKETMSVPPGLKSGHEIEGVHGLVLNSHFGRMIFPITFCRNVIFLVLITT